MIIDNPHRSPPKPQRILEGEHLFTPAEGHTNARTVHWNETVEERLKAAEKRIGELERKVELLRSLVHEVVGDL